MQRAGTERTGARERGVALVIVLYTLVAIALVVGIFGRTIFTGRSTVANEAAHARAHAMLPAGLDRAIVALADTVPDRRWRADGSLHEFTLDGGTVSLGIADERGKIDLNAAVPALLKSLLIESGAAGNEAAAIVAQIERRRAAFRAADPGNPTPKVFRNTAELRAIDGVTGPLYDALAPLVTVYSGQPTVNPATASAAVMAALIGIDRPDLVQPTATGGTAALNQARQIMQHLPEASSWLRAGEGGPFYTISVNARTDDGAAASADFVIWQRGSSFSVIERRDGAL
jgi:general secretion pathway protein K